MKVKIMKPRTPGFWTSCWGWYWVSPEGKEYGNFLSHMTWQQAYTNAETTLRALGAIR